MSYLNLSKSIARYLITKTGASVEEGILAYAAEVLFLNILSVVVALLLASWARVLPETLCCLGVVAVIRPFAGGAHSTSAARCTAVTGVVFPSLGLAARRIALLSPVSATWLPLVALALGLTAAASLAPVDSPAAPIISSQRRARLKAGAIVTVGLLSATAFFLVDGALRVSLSLGILWSAFILTPAAHGLFRFIDSLSLR